MKIYQSILIKIFLCYSEEMDQHYQNKLRKLNTLFGHILVKIFIQIYCFPQKTAIPNKTTLLNVWCFGFFFS